MNPKLLLDKHRGVYFAANVTAIRETPAGVAVDAEGLRHVFYYSAQEAGHRGVYGLATKGPADGAKVGPPVTGTRYDVVGIADATDEAVARFGKATW
jgi:hypothetical protein